MINQVINPQMNTKTQQQYLTQRHKSISKSVYQNTKNKMENFQRNIFGFSNRVQIKSFESILTLFLVLLFSFLIISYISQKIVQIEQKKFDVLRSTEGTEKYSEIGRVNILKDTNLLPYIEIKVNNFSKISKFGVFTPHQKLNSSNPKNMWDTLYMPNIAELNKYINIVVYVNHKDKGQSKYIQKSFRQCKSNDFTERGYNNHNMDVDFFLCPDIEFLQDWMFVENSFESKNQRYSFEIMINKCQAQLAGLVQCANDNDIKELIAELIFNVSFLKSRINFRKDIKQNPIEHKVSFFQQFAISLDNYRDTNNFVLQNQVYYDKSRILSLGIIKDKIYDIKSNPTWYSSRPQYNNLYISTNGTNYSYVQVQNLMGMFFFLSDEVHIQERQLYTYILFLGQLGGILGLIMSILKFIVDPIKFNFDLAKIIQILYFKSNNKNIFKKEEPEIYRFYKLQQKSKEQTQFGQQTQFDHFTNTDHHNFQNLVDENKGSVDDKSCSQQRSHDLVLDHDKYASIKNKTDFQLDKVNSHSRSIQIDDLAFNMDQNQGQNPNRDQSMSDHQNYQCDVGNSSQLDFIEFNKLDKLQQQTIIQPRHKQNQNNIRINQKIVEEIATSTNQQKEKKNQVLIGKIYKTLKSDQKNDYRHVNYSKRNTIQENLRLNTNESACPKKMSQNHNPGGIRSQFQIDKIKKIHQIRTKYNFDEIEDRRQLHCLKFTTLDILNDLLPMKPIFYILKSTRFVKNYKIYNTLKQDLLEKLQIQKIVKQIKKIRNIDKKLQIVSQYLESIQDGLNIQEQSDYSSQSKSNLEKKDSSRLDSYILIDKKNKVQIK